MFIIMAIFPHGDAQVVAMQKDRTDALSQWKEYVLNGETLETITDDERRYLASACCDLWEHGRSQPQDSKVFYRMQLMRE